MLRYTVSLLLCLEGITHSSNCPEDTYRLLQRRNFNTHANTLHVGGKMYEVMSMINFVIRTFPLLLLHGSSVVRNTDE